MIKYQVRSRELISLINDIRDKRLIKSPYFQRNLVWRETHKVDFIRTILMGYPFPQIFIAKGSIDLDTMTTTACIVDGQQRMNAIDEYIENKYKVDKRLFADLDPGEKERFFKYLIPIIELDIQNDDPEIKEIFQRLNKTFYSLSTVEKLSTEYATSELMLVAKMLAKEISFKEIDEIEEFDDPNLELDPNIPDTFKVWAKEIDTENYNNFILNLGVFSPYEISRQVHLLFTINVIVTYLSDFYNRNVGAKDKLEELSESFPSKDEVIAKFNRCAMLILNLDFDPKSYWLNKSNVFSLVTLIVKNIDEIEQIDSQEIRTKLKDFRDNLHPDYELAAKESVNNRPQRLIRNKFLKELLLN